MFAQMLRNVYDPLESHRFGLIPSLLTDDYFQPHVHLNIIRPRRQISVETLKCQDDSSKYQVLLNVKHFRPEEIDVKTIDNCVVIRGRHEEHADEHGFVSREFTRRYQLPDDVKPETIKSSLSQDGILTIQAPRKVLEPPPKNERIVPITMQKLAAVEPKQMQQEQEQNTDVELKQ